MFPYLKENIILVDGPEATGVYDLNRGRFHRVSLAAGTLLKKLNGTLAEDLLSTSDLNFVAEGKRLEILGSSEESAEKNQSRLKDHLRSFRPVKFAWIEITSLCNQKCAHCFLGTDLNQFKHQAFETIKNHIDVLVHAGVKQLVLSGGEPTTHPEIAKILEYACAHPVKVTLLTNGSSRFSTKLASVLKDLSVNVKIPVLGWRNSHDTMAGLPGGFRRTLKTIHEYVKAGVMVELGTTVTASNYDDINQVRRYANWMGLALEVSPLFKIGFAKKNEAQLYSVSQKDIIQKCREVPRLRRKALRRFPEPTRLLPERDPYVYQSVDLRNYLTDRQECGQKIIAILSSGLVTPCLLLRDESHAIGNLHQNTLAEILSPQFTGWRGKDSQLKLDDVIGCNRCEARFVCKAGACPATAQALSGSVNRKNPMYSQCYYINKEPAPA